MTRRLILSWTLDWAYPKCSFVLRQSWSLRQISTRGPRAGQMRMPPCRSQVQVPLSLHSWNPLVLYWGTWGNLSRRDRARQGRVHRPNNVGVHGPSTAVDHHGERRSGAMDGVRHKGRCESLAGSRCRLTARDSQGPRSETSAPCDPLDILHPRWAREKVWDVTVGERQCDDGNVEGMPT